MSLEEKKSERVNNQIAELIQTASQAFKRKGQRVHQNLVWSIFHILTLAVAIAINLVISDHEITDIHI